MAGLPGNIDLQGGFGGGKIAIKGSVDAKGTIAADHVRGPGCLGVRALHSPAGAGGRSLRDEHQGRDAAQRLQGRGHDAEGRLERARGRGAVPRRPQGHADRHRQCRRHPARRQRAARRRRPAPRRLRPRRRPRSRQRLVPDHAVLGELARPLGPVRHGAAGRGRGPRQQDAERARSRSTSSETRFTFRAAATVGGGSAGVDLVYDPTGRDRAGDADGHGQSRVARRALDPARLRSRACATRSATSTCACAAAAARRAMR